MFVCFCLFDTFWDQDSPSIFMVTAFGDMGSNNTVKYQSTSATPSKKMAALFMLTSTGWLLFCSCAYLFYRMRFPLVPTCAALILLLLLLNSTVLCRERFKYFDAKEYTKVLKDIHKAHPTIAHLYKAGKSVKGNSDILFTYLIVVYLCNSFDS